jgi:hypothetical protein
VSDVIAPNPDGADTVPIQNLIDTERRTPMRLIITQYLDAEPVDVTGKLEEAVVPGLDAAAGRVAAERSDFRIEQVAAGIRLRGGLSTLDGGELCVGGSERLTILEFSLPWAAGDGSGAKYLAANAFAHSVADAVGAAA